MYMCEFHLKGQCFHPEKTEKGLVASGCEFHDCSQCTNKNWQQEKIAEHYAYYQSIITISQASNNQNQPTTQKKPLLSRIFSSN